MITMRYSALVLRPSLVLIAMLSSPVQAQVLYHITPLPGMNSPTGTTVATDLSEDGRVIVGRTDPKQNGKVGATHPRATQWTDGEMSILPHFTPSFGLNGGATGVNAAGTVVGGLYYSFSSEFKHYTHAVVWKDGAIHDLGALPGDPHSFGEAINDAGVVVGTSGWLFAFLAPDRAFRWQDGVMEQLPGLPGAVDADAKDINEAGVIVGASGDFGSFFQPTASAVYWDGGGPITLPLPPGAASARASKINDHGVIVGGAGTTIPVVFDFTFAPVRWQGGEAEWLPLLPGDNFGWVYDINNDGVIVGTSGLADLQSGSIMEDPVPVIWIDGHVHELSAVIDTPGWSFDIFDGALGINDLGELVGTGKLKGKSRAFLATPVP